MKKSFIVPALLVLVGGVLWLLLPKQSPPLAEPVLQGKPFTKPSTRLPMIKLSRVEPLETWQSDGTPPKIIPPEWQSDTDDPAVVDLFSNLKWVDVGRIVKTESGTQQLWDGTRLIFEAKRIGKRRSMAADGTIALDAVTGTQTPIEDAEVVGNTHFRKVQ